MFRQHEVTQIMPFETSKIRPIFKCRTAAQERRGPPHIAILPGLGCQTEVPHVQQLLREIDSLFGLLTMRLRGVKVALRVLKGTSCLGLLAENDDRTDRQSDRCQQQEYNSRSHQRPMSPRPFGRSLNQRRWFRFDWAMFEERS